MLTELEVRNFQNHRRFILPLNDKVVVITGRNDAGKSALLRALRWVCLNRPSGSSFIRRDSKRGIARVTLHVDGQTIIREKGNRTNCYKVNGKKLAAIGPTVPQPVSEILSIGENQFLSHHAAPFWFGLTPGQVAKELNRIVNLNRIDSSLAWVAAKVRRCKAAVDVSSDRLRDAESALDRLAGVPALVQDWEALKERYNDVLQLLEKASRIAELSAEAARIHCGGDRALALANSLSACVSLADACRSTETKLGRLLNLNCERDRTTAELEQHGREADRLEAKESPAPRPGETDIDRDARLAKARAEMDQKEAERKTKDEADQRERAGRKIRQIAQKMRDRVGEFLDLPMTPKREQSIRAAFSLMVDNDPDHAELRNGIGFNQPDSMSARWLGYRMGTPEELVAMHGLLWKYKRQLSGQFPELWPS